MAIERLKNIPVSLHCWQGNVVTGFDHDGPLTVEIQNEMKTMLFSDIWDEYCRQCGVKTDRAWFG